MNEKTTPERRKELKAIYRGIPEMQSEPGVYVQTFGYKYVTIMSTHNGGGIGRCCYDCFDAGEYFTCEHK